MSRQIPPFIFETANIDGADSWGLEIEASYDDDWGKVTAWYALNDLEPDRQGQNLRALEPAHHKAGLTARVHVLEDLTAQLDYKYASETKDAFVAFSAAQDVSEYHRADLALSKGIADFGEVLVGVSDIFDETEFVVSGLGTHVTPGRTFFARLQFRF